MSDSVGSKKKRRRAGKWLLWFGASLLILIALVATAVLFLHRLISTEWFRNRFEQQASQSLDRAVQVESLTWSWSRGIILEGVRIADEPDFSEKPFLELGYVHLFVDVRSLLRRKILFDIDLDGLSAHLIRSSDGRTNLDRLLAQFQPSEKKAPEAPGEDWRTLTFEAPKEVEGHVRLNNLSLLYEDRLRGSTLKADQGSLQLDIPSMDQPIELKASLNLEMDGKPLQGIHVSARVENFTDSHGRIAPVLAETHVEVTVPGARVLVDGSPADTSLDTRIHLDLAQLLGSVEPFLPADLPTGTGSVDLHVTAKAMDPETFLFDSKVVAKGLEISGGPLTAGPIGPAELKVFQEGTFHLNKDLLEIKSGELQIQENSRLAWRGKLEGASRAKPTADIQLGPVYLDLHELVNLVRPLLPADFSLPKGRNGETMEAELRLDELRLTGPLPEGPNQMEIQGVSLTVPAMALDLPGGSASVEKVALRVLKGEAGLEGGLPSRVRLSAYCGMERFQMSGTQAVTFEKLELTPIEVSVEGLVPSEGGLIGFTGNLSLSENVMLKGLDLPNRTRISELRQGLHLECRLEADRSVSLDMKELTVAVPSIEVQALPQGIVTTSLDLKGAATGVRLTGLKPVRLDAERFESRLQIGKFLEAGVQLGVRNAGFERLDAEGHATLNLAELSPFLPRDLSVKGNMGGELALNWQFSGRLPAAREMEHLAEALSSKDQWAERFRFVDKLHLTASLNDIFLDIPSEDQTALKIGRISSKKPFRLTMEQGLLRNRVTGDLEVERIQALPVIGDLGQTLGMHLTLSGSLDEFKRVSLDEAIVVEPLGLKQTAQLDLSGVDRLAARQGGALLPAILQSVEGSVQGSLSLNGGESLSKLKDDLSLVGDIDAGARVQMIPGRELKAGAWLNSSGLDAKLGDLFQVSNLQSHVNMEKQYHLAKVDNARSSATDAGTFLSVQVLEPRPVISEPGNAGDSILRRLADDLQGRFGRKPSLSFDAARFRAAGLPIELTNQQMEFRLVKGLPVFDYFRMDLLGGSILGSFSVAKAEADFAIRADLGFSGINAKKLIPDTIGGVSDEEAEISGQMSLRVPLLENVNRILEALNLELDLTRIGSRALERFLFALDPYESNESIVSQRKLLRIGTPKWIKLSIRDGNFSLSGQVEARGARIDLPGIERVNVASLPKLRGIEKSLSSLGAVINLLKAASATAITLDSDGRLRFEDDGS